MISSRTIQFILFIIGILIVASTIFMQMQMGLEPCPLCIIQRVILGALTVICLIFILHNPKNIGIRTYNVILFIVAIIGIGIASRHVWLQHLPPGQAPACGPGLNYMISNMPVGDTVREVLTGSGECAKVHLRMIGLTLPEWSLIVFFGYALVALFQIFKPLKKQA